MKDGALRGAAQPGTVLLSLVPQSEPLVAEVSIENKDIGFGEGQPVRLKLAAYPFQKYGMLEGVVKTVSADSSARDASTPAGASTRGQTSDSAPQHQRVVSCGNLQCVQQRDVIRGRSARSAGRRAMPEAGICASARATIAQASACFRWGLSGEAGATRTTDFCRQT